MKRIILNTLILLTLLAFGTNVFAANSSRNLRTLYLTNNAIIYSVNIRTFNALDKNGNGIIEEKRGEQRGNFINAIKRLDELSSAGVNTIELMGVLPVGKIKALGTAGDLDAVVSFNQINPQLKTLRGKSVSDEMKRFVRECHKRNINVIVQLPAFAGYDMYLKNPTLFLKDENGKPLSPSDRNDVVIFNAGTADKVNNDVYNLYKGFIDMMLDMDIDGISVKNPETKPFWKSLITYARKYNSEMLFIAQTTNKEREELSKIMPVSSLNALLDAGFDGYYGKYNNIKNMLDANSIANLVKEDMTLSKKYNGKKKVCGNFVTQNDVSPRLTDGADYSKMLIWLSATLPLNTYYVDGFSTGDDYMYPLSNKRAIETFTDDKTYFMHRGQIDTFNFSRRPIGFNFDIYTDFVTANKLKQLIPDIISNGNFNQLKTNKPSTLAYSRSSGGNTMIVIVNLSKATMNGNKIKVPKISQKTESIPIKVMNIPLISQGTISTDLNPMEVQVLLFKNFEVK